MGRRTAVVAHRSSVGRILETDLVAKEAVGALPSQEAAVLLVWAISLTTIWALPDRQPRLSVLPGSILISGGPRFLFRTTSRSIRS